MKPAMYIFINLRRQEHHSVMDHVYTHTDKQEMRCRLYSMAYWSAMKVPSPA